MRTVTEALRHTLVLALAAALAVGPAAPRAFAGPTQIAGGNGKGHVLPQGSDPTRWTVEVQNGAIIHYSSFDVAIGEAVNFAGLGGGDIRVLNRIFSASPTHINGDITQSGGNIHVYMVNPAGVFFGPESHVNVTAMQAAAGRMSDRDFEKGNDHFTGLRGTVRNEGEIAAKAVSLVGGKVENSGRVIAEGGWIVMAAGRDVLIGRDGNGNGVLLRVEGAANAVFNQNARGVENTGTIQATASTDPATPNLGGHVSLGAGDLYGTAIFSNGAIEARKLALAADNRGDIALGGTVTTNDFEAKFAGNQTGALRKADATPGAQTITANTVNLTATGDHGTVKVLDDVALRSAADPSQAPATVTVEQKASLFTSALAGLDLGADRAGTALTLKSTGGSIAVEDRRLVNGTQLEVDAHNLIDIRGTDALDVDNLKLDAFTTLSDADLIARGTRSAGDIDAITNLGFLTKPGGALISAHEGNLNVTSDVTTSDGGVLTIEAKNVTLGSFDDVRGARGGIIDVSGAQPNGVKIGFTDSAGVQQTETVTLNAINTSGRTLKENDPPVRGGDVDVNANRDITIRQSINTKGEPGPNARTPNLPGGSVHIAANNPDAVLTVGSILTGGGDAPAAGAAEQGNVSLHASRIIANGDIDTRGGTVGNADGSRNRSVLIDGIFEVGTNPLTVFSGDFTVTGLTREAFVPGSTNRVDASLLVNSTGTTRFQDGVSLDSLEIDNTGGDVVFGGSVRAEKSFDVFFDTAGTGHILTSNGPITVYSRGVSLIAQQSGTSNGGPPTTAAVDLTDDVHFNLLDVDQNADPKVDDFARGRFTLDQDAAITDATTAMLFKPDRFQVTSPVPFDPDHPDAPLATETRSGLSQERVELTSNSSVSLDADARTALSGSALVATGSTFGVTGAPSLLNLKSLEVNAFDDLALDGSFGVTATDGVTLRSGLDGTGNISLGSVIRADAIALEAGDGAGGADGATVSITPDAVLRGAAGGNAKQVVIRQDAALDTSSLPLASAYGDGPNPLVGLDYQLESRDGGVTVAQGASLDKITGSKLSLTGAGPVDLGAADLSLGALTVHTPGELSVSNNITTAPDGKIELHAGTDGTKNLIISSTLAAKDIELFAGSGKGSQKTSRVDLQPGAFFSGAGPTPSAPTRFVLEQDASIGESGSGTQVPSQSLFAGPISDMEFALRSKGSTVRIADPNAVNDTKLELEGGAGINVLGALGVVSLETTGAVTFQGNVTADQNVTLHGAVTLSDTSQSVTHRIQAGGDLTAEGAISKTSEGDLELHADHDLSIADASTAHHGAALLVEGVHSVKTGALDASANRSDSAGGKVTVTSTGGAVDVGRIDARGFVGKAQTANSLPEDSRGTNGGAVSIEGTNVSVGTVTTAAGPGGEPIDTSNQKGSTRGGDGGAITITATAPGGTIELAGNVIADAGAGASSEATPPDPRDISGHSGDVTLNGDVRLVASRQTADGADDGPTNVIHGGAVSIHGDVKPGTAPDPNSTAEPPAELPIAAGFTALDVVADGALRIDGDVTAGRINLETHSGDLRLSDSRVTRLAADEIRLAATDGHGKDLDSVVDLSGFSFVGSNEHGAVSKFTLEQDASIGASAGGTAIPNVGIFDGDGRTRPFSLGLVSQDGDVVLGAADIANVRGTNLTLAANGLAGSANPIRVAGADLLVRTLSLGTGTVGGKTFIERSLEVGDSTTANGVALTAFGDIQVGDAASPILRDATISGGTTFSGSESQTLAVTGVLDLGGSTNAKTGGGDLTLHASDIVLSADFTQGIVNDHGALVIASDRGGLVKETGGIILRGTTADDTRPAIRIQGTRTIDGREVALATLGGNLSVTAVTVPASGGNPGVGTYDFDGDVLAIGNATLSGRAILDAGRDSYRFDARRNLATGTGGELTLGGVASADADLTLSAEGAPVTIDALRPSAIHLTGDFKNLAGKLVVDGDMDVIGDTTIEANGDVVFGAFNADGDLASGSRIQGDKNLDVTSHGTLYVGDDVAMTAGTLGLRGDSGVRFVSTSDSQSIEAGVISLGNGAASPPKGRGSLLRDGSLVLAASSGNVNVARNQRLMVNGDLTVQAAAGVVLADTAALGLRVTSGDIGVYGGSTVAANSIQVSSAPRVIGGGIATFAVPTRTEISSNVPSDDVLVRGIFANGAPLAFASAGPGLPFNPEFPVITGAAIFDFARQIPQFNPQHAITRPHADAVDLAEAVQARPLWAEELLAYLEMRSVETPTDEGKPADAEHLPPVGARPGEQIESSDARVRGAAVENAVALYRGLFRPELRRDSETGLIESPSHTADIKAAFQAPIDSLRRKGSSKVVDAADVASLVESDSRFEAARRYRTQLGSLLDVSSRALAPDQRPRFRALVLAEVTPYGIAPAEFSSLF